MRDPKRIPKVLETVRRLWVKSPDLRLCQLLNVVANVGKEKFGDDLFYLEDEKLIEFLQNYEWDKNPKN